MRLEKKLSKKNVIRIVIAKKETTVQCYVKKARKTKAKKKLAKHFLFRKAFLVGAKRVKNVERTSVSQLKVC